jgi:hypothetical protein
MAYRRYDKTSDWYIFWETSSAKSKEDERIAVWHKDHRAAAPNFSYREVLAMLEENNFGGVPGFSTRDSDVLRRAFQEFVADVDAEYSSRAS